MYDTGIDAKIRILPVILSYREATLLEFYLLYFFIKLDVLQELSSVI